MGERTAEIAGGGIAGLACGWALALRGWKVRVHERSPEIREVGAGIYLMRNTVSIFEYHGIAGTILRNSVTLTGTERRDAEGRLIQHRSFDPAEPWYVLPRADLVLGLAEAARRAGVEIVTDSMITGMHADGTVVTAAGERRRVDLAVAANGFRSRLRDALGLTGLVEERSAGATRLLIPRGAAEADLVMREYWSGKRRIGITPSSPGLTYAYLSCPNDDARGTALPLDTASWKAAFPALAGFFDRIPEDTALVRHAYPLAKAKAWSNGRAAIVGDAATALPPTLAQGAGLAITNGYSLAKTLEGHRDVTAGLKAWEAEYRWISDQTQNWSARLDSLTTHWPPALAPLRRGVIWAIGAVLNDRVRVADRVRLAP
ncbi:FAD-dependent oxidoreductase [Ancylobacter defluvii]|uniref:Monooxygenase n=1 Tax=Ancylobacter defluvii TaxID=1282440 RepID=A0A9W6JU58_9HYPH|nr:NAD(P)/FAD-dependent oxidoreductase [Ancylobacter defluvii]MBS7588526.1 FAD-dependent monooxygenase [Ancylobacter defluvii]GLK83806.1 monooxygenase [Ancylobacter defluvii]